MNYNIVLILVAVITISIILKQIWDGLFSSINKELENEITLVSLGMFEQNGKIHDLEHYFVDENSKLYSTNPKTWEVKPRDYRDLLVCSDKSRDKSGYIINSLRSKTGVKVTIRRKNITFAKLSAKNQKFSLRAHVNTKTNRHLSLSY